MRRRPWLLWHRSCASTLAGLVLLALLGAFATHAPDHASAAALSVDEARRQRQVLEMICAAGDISGAECRKAKGYPSTMEGDCEVTLIGPGFSGQFIRGRGRLTLVPYSSTCEAHVTNFGGGLLIEEPAAGGAAKFLGYRQGSNETRCAVVDGRGGADQLYCLTAYTGQGTTESTISQLRFTQNYMGEVSIALDVIERAQDDSGREGVAQVGCSDAAQIFGYAAIRNGATDGTVEVDVTVANPAYVAQLCKSGTSEASRPSTAELPAYIDVPYVLELNSRAFVEKSAFTPVASPAPAAGSTVLDKTALGRRVALVVANGNYQNVPHLPNPPNDAALVSGVLTSLGFESVAMVTDATKGDLQKALLDFSDAASDADWALVYFAGHGIELEGINYVLPVDARLKRDQHIRIEGTALDDLIEAAASARQVRIVVLDACRDNPFLARMVRSVGVRSVGNTLAAVEPQKATLVAYSTKHGTVALDGASKYSPFAEAFARHLKEPGVDIGLMFRRVRDTVLEATANRQEPYTYGSLPGRQLSFFPLR